MIEEEIIPIGVCPKEKPECDVVCKGLDWELEEANRLIGFVRGRTDENPFFAVMTGAMHGGPIEYHRQQPYVEELSRLNPKDLTDIDYVESQIKGSQHWIGRSKSVVDLSDCFIKVCGVDGRKCKTPKGRERLMDCARGAFGIGEKTIDLMKEYLGDNEAVAVDRHVGHWTCKDAEIKCPTVTKKLWEWEGRLYEQQPYDFEKAKWVGERVRRTVQYDFVKGKAIPPKVYDEIKESIRTKAKECNIQPVQLQVASWIKGACDAMPDGPIFVGEGHYLHCERRKEMKKKLEEFMGV